MKIVAAPLLLLLLLSSCSEKMPARVRIENGNVFIAYVDNTQKQVSDMGVDKEAILSPDGRKLAFIRKTPVIDTSTMCNEQDMICLYDLKADKIDTIIRPRKDNSPEEELSDLNSLAFSPDGHILYFTGCAWVTSSAIHQYELAGGKEKFISAGNSLRIVESGKYKGYIIASKHKYYEGEAGGSYDHYWLLDKDGKEIKDLGDKEDADLPE